MLDRLNHLALKALDKLDDALDESGAVGVNAAKVILEWRSKITIEENLMTRLEELERLAKERQALDQES